MKYYVIIGHKQGEHYDNAISYNKLAFDWLEIIARDDPYGPGDSPPGAHQFFGYLDVNFGESAQYGSRATKTQEAWLIGRHRISRMIDFSNLGYKFIRERSTKRI